MPSFRISVFILIGLMSCSESTSNLNEATIEIDLPVDQMAVYASAVYTDRTDSLILNNLKMSSIVFTDRIQSGDSTYLLAEVMEFIPENYPGHGTIEGTLKLSVTKKWISFENETNITSTFLYKTSTDTTATPTTNFQHNTIYPKVLVEGQVREIFRPAGNLFSAGYKKFSVGREINWDDSFGFNSGLYVETQSNFANADTLFTIAIYDEHGLIISQYSLDFIFTGGEPPFVSDTIRVHNISRRVNDYTNPLLTRELNFYADQVLQNDLTPIYR